MLQVIKRDGRTVEFDKSKIRNAVLKAFEEVDSEISQEAKNKAAEIASYIFKEDKTICVEDIQDIVEEKLMASKRKDVARAFIIYRNNRTKIREKNMKLMKDISEKLTATNVQNQKNFSANYNYI